MKKPVNPKEARGYKKSTNLFYSFGYAMRGLAAGLASERNLRIHCFVAGFVLYFSKYYALSRAEFALLLLLIGLVVVSELFNTALETMVDLVSPNYDPLAAKVKDIAAGAVLFTSTISLLIGIYLFYDIPTLTIILAHIRTRWYIFLPLVLVCLVAIFLPETIQHYNQQEDSTP